MQREIIENLILRMLLDLYKHKVEDGEFDPEFDPKFVSKAISRGYYWALDEKYGLSDPPAPRPQIVSEVYELLDMWSFIEHRYAKLSAEDKERVKSEAALFGGDVKFPGFDGNDQAGHFFIAQFLIKDMGKYHEFKEHHLNSHSPNIDAHRRMLAVYESMQETFVGGELSASQIIDLLKARKHQGE